MAIAPTTTLTIFNTSGPKRDIAVGSGVAVGIGGYLLGAGYLLSAASGLGTIAAVWWGLNNLGKTAAPNAGAPINLGNPAPK